MDLGFCGGDYDAFGAATTYVTVCKGRIFNMWFFNKLQIAHFPPRIPRDLPLIFASGLYIFPSEYALSEAMVNYWTNFAVSGDPNKPTPGVAWPAYTATEDVTLELGDTVRVVRDLKRAQCDFWDAVPPPWKRRAAPLVWP